MVSSSKYVFWLILISHPSTPSKRKDWLPYSEVSPFRMFKKESKPILSLYFIANALLRSNASRPAFDRVSSHVRSCLVPRSLKSIGTAAPTHYFRVFKIEYWQQRPHIEDMCWPAVIVCCGASIVAHFAAKVSYSASPQSSPNVRAAVLFTALARM